MAYVRKKGNQLAIVHGERAAGSGEVVQNTLFTFFSKAEAYRAQIHSRLCHQRNCCWSTSSNLNF